MLDYYLQTTVNSVSDSAPAAVMFQHRLGTVSLIKFASRSLPVIVHQEKKPQSKKNSTVIDREFDFLSITVEFSASGFFL